MKKASTLPTLLLLIWGLVGLNPLFSQTFPQLGQDIVGTENSDGFGSSISLSQDGARLAVGASFHNLQKGLVRVYEFDANLNQWNQLGQDLNGIQHGSRFGFRVSLSSDGNRVAIGAPYYEQSQPLQGMIQILEYNPTTQLWEQVGQSLEGDADEFWGSKVELCDGGNKLVFLYSGGGHIYEFDASSNLWNPFAHFNGVNDLASDATASRVAYLINGYWAVYEFNTGQISQSTYIGHDYPEAISLASNGNRVAFQASGTPYQLKVFEAGNGNGLSQWVQIGQGITNYRSVAGFAHDGNRVVTQSPWTPRDPNRAYIHDYDPVRETWIQVGNGIEGGSANGGMPLALSGNGNIIATSTPRIGGFRGTEIGEVKVYRIMNTPIPPTNLAINADTAFFASLRWQDNSSDEDGFIIRRQQGNGPWAILDYVPADQFWYYDLLAMDGQTYHYTVSAYNSHDESAEAGPATYQSPDPNAFQPLDLSYLCYNPQSDQLTWLVQNDNPYAISFIWAQYFSTQRDTVYALPNQTVSFQTVNNPQTPQTFDDDNLTGIWYWGPNWETLRDLERNNLDLNLHCANRLDGVVMAPQAHKIPGPVDLSIDPAELMQHAFILSPNPAQDALIFRLREPVDQAATFTVSNMMGQELMTARGNLLQPTKLDVSQLSQGIYLVRINTGGTSVSHKFEKIR